VGDLAGDVAPVPLYAQNVVGFAQSSQDILEALRLRPPSISIAQSRLLEPEPGAVKAQHRLLQI
jgi:hypothetical protein